MTENRNHLQMKVTSRGFLHAPPIHDSYSGSDVRVYESSSSTVAAIWLRITNADGGDSVIHLPIEDAQKLSEQINTLILNHYQKGKS